MVRSSLLVLVLASICVGCASSGGVAPDASADAGPQKQPFQAPAWESTEFRSEDGLFFIHYPADFQVQPSQSPTTLHTAASPSLVPRVDLNRLDGLDGQGLEQVATGLEQTMAQLGGGEAEVTASQMVTLSDGVTEAMEFDVSWTFQGFPLASLVLVVPVGEYHLNLTVTGADGGERSELAGIAYTLYLP